MLARTGEAALFEHVVPNLTDDDVDALLSVLDRHKRLGILAGASEEARRRALRDKCGRQLIVAMIEATTGERFEQKLQDELLELPGLQRFIYSVLCLAGQEKHYLTRDEVLLAAQGLPGGDPFEALTLLVRRHVASAPPPGTQYRPRHHVIAQVVVQALGDRGQLCDPLKALVYALASKADPLLNRRDRVWRLLARLINHGFLLNLLGDVSEIRSIYSSVEALLGRDHHYWLQRGSLEVENGDLRRAEQFLSQARSLAPDDYKVDTEYGYLLMRKAIAEPQHRQARTWVEEATQLLEGVISTRGDTDYYPFHVLGAQGLSWARRVTTTDERRRLLNYFLNLVEQGTKKHPWRRDLDQLRIDIQRDLLLTAAATEGPFQ
jgi:tetratricopeptide (TPR) repeat protein